MSKKEQEISFDEVQRSMIIGIIDRSGMNYFFEELLKAMISRDFSHTGFTDVEGLRGFECIAELNDAEKALLTIHEKFKNDFSVLESAYEVCCRRMDSRDDKKFLSESASALNNLENYIELSKKFIWQSLIKRLRKEMDLSEKTLMVGKDFKVFSLPFENCFGLMHDITQKVMK